MRDAGFALGPREVGRGAPALVVAEVASAHEGSADTACKMVDAAFRMGADAILFQIYRTEHWVVHRHPARRELERLELPPGEWSRVLAAARSSGLALLVEALDPPSLELATAAGVDGLHVPAGDVDRPDWLRIVSALAKPIFLATGPEDSLRLEILGALPGPILLLHGASGTPASAEDLRLNELATLRDRLRLPVGLLDRTDGASAFALVAPALAVALGADAVQKPFCLDRSHTGPAHPCALAPEDFHRMVEFLRQAEEATRSDHSPAGVPTRRGAGRSVVAAVLIPRGTVLTLEQLAYKRVDERLDQGLQPGEAHRLIGRRAGRPIQADEVIREEMLE